MKLELISLRRVPGIDPPFALDGLCAGINVVVGPNGSGKTSVCKALAATLWPGREQSSKLEVETVWDDDGHSLRGEREGARVQWQRDAAPAEAPPLPDQSLSACYTMGVRDLIVRDHATDSDIAREIRVQMSGGYDLGRVVADHFSLAPRLGAKERHERDDAQRALRSVQQKFRALGCEEDRLGELEEQEQAAHSAQAEVARLRDAAELARARQGLSIHEAELGGFPEGMAALDGSDLETLGELEKARELAANDVAESSAQLERASAEIDESGLGGARPDEQVLEAWLERLRAVEQLERQLATAEERHGDARVALERAREGLGSSDDSPAIPDLSREALDEAEALLRRLDNLREKRAGVKTQIEILGGVSSGEDVDRLARAADRLRDWLAWSGAAAFTVTLWPIALAAALAVGGAALAVYHHPAWLILVGMGTTVALGGVALRVFARGHGERRRHYAREFEELSADKLPEWQAEAVRAKLRDFDERLARARAAEKLRDQLAPLQQRLAELGDEEAALHGERAALRAELGIDVGSDLSLVVLAGHCRAYNEAAAELTRLDGEIERFRAKSSETRARLASFLAPYDDTVDDDPIGLRSRLEGLQRRLGKYDSACQARTIAAAQRDKARTAEQQAVARIRRFYAERSLAPDDRRGLEDRLALRESYAKSVVGRDDEARRVRDLESKLADRPDLLAVSKQEAEERCVAAERRAQGLTKISAEIGAIRGRVKDAGERDEMEDALATLAQADDRLAEVCEQAELVAAGRFLLEQVDREHEKESRPAVLEQAMQYFAAFTHNAYELRLPEGQGGEFRAMETSNGNGLALGELSEGTRIQLLLAVRLAFAISAERGCRLPLIFDEVLSTADPERFAAIAESLGVLAAEGRQIIYLTSNPADAVFWKKVCECNAAAELCIIDLGAVRGQQAALKDLAALEIPAIPVVPSPDGMTPQSYGRAIQVPPADANANIESLHMFYVLRDDLAVLYRVMREFRITTLGQWESLSASGRARRLLPAELCDRLDALCLCARTVHVARAVGRGKPVSAQVLEDSGAVTTRFMEPVLDLTRDLRGDGRELVKVIDERSDDRIKGFKTDKLTELRTYLEERGCIDDRPVLAVSEIHIRTLDAARDAVKTGVLTPIECSDFVDQLLATLEGRSAGDGGWRQD